ncbi:hypothetical protein Cgig2_007778 [Carnegiea gigantea]|uniref:Uncharacterized protein n=1 Tax=Carnegiea gigantea TaxID=171969 RepID=A0A9Q1K1X3_9CARY|nr:hypothetical protein Cgig2_007778 [Carnegiea gigantea]
MQKKGEKEESGSHDKNVFCFFLSESKLEKGRNDLVHLGKLGLGLGNGEEKEGRRGKTMFWASNRRKEGMSWAIRESLARVLEMEKRKKRDGGKACFGPQVLNRLEKGGNELGRWGKPSPRSRNGEEKEATRGKTIESRLEKGGNQLGLWGKPGQQLEKGGNELGCWGKPGPESRLEKGGNELGHWGKLSPRSRNGDQKEGRRGKTMFWALGVVQQVRTREKKGADWARV